MSEILRAVLLLTGGCLIVYGAWLAWPPAAPLLAGAALMRVAMYRKTVTGETRDAATGR